MLQEHQHERRQQQRIDLPFKMMHAPFVFPGPNNPALVSGEIVNVSSTGLLFHSEISYRVNGLARVEIKLGSWDNYVEGFQAFKYIYQNEPFVVLGKVLRCSLLATSVDRKRSEFGLSEIYETAVQYVSVDPAHQAAVARFIQKLTQKKVTHEDSGRR